MPGRVSVPAPKCREQAKPGMIRFTASANRGNDAERSRLGRDSEATTSSSPTIDEHVPT